MTSRIKSSLTFHFWQLQVYVEFLLDFGPTSRLVFVWCKLHLMFFNLNMSSACLAASGNYSDELIASVDSNGLRAALARTDDGRICSEKFCYAGQDCHYRWWVNTCPHNKRGCNKLPILGDFPTATHTARRLEPLATTTLASMEEPASRMVWITTGKFRFAIIGRFPTIHLIISCVVDAIALLVSMAIAVRRDRLCAPAFSVLMAGPASQCLAVEQG